MLLVQVILNHEGISRAPKFVLLSIWLTNQPSKPFTSFAATKLTVATHLQSFTERTNLDLSRDGLRMESFRPHVCICAHHLISMAKKS